MFSPGMAPGTVVQGILCLEETVGLEVGTQAHQERKASGWMEPLRPFGHVCPPCNWSENLSLGVGADVEQKGRWTWANLFECS